MKGVDTAAGPHTG